MKNLSSSTLFGLSIFAGRKEQLLELLLSRIAPSQLFQAAARASTASHDQSNNSCLLIGTPNPEQIVEAESNRLFGHNLRNLDLLIPDGIGLVWASAWLKRFSKTERKLAQRVAGVDLLSDLLSELAVDKVRVLIVGGRQYAGAVLKLATSDVEIKQLDVGKEGREAGVRWLEGYLQISKPSAQEEARVERALSSFRPQLVLVPLGAPWQEKWLVDHRGQLDRAGVKVAMAVGGAIDMLTGGASRAPRVMQQIGLEWLWRLLSQPWRWRRQVRLPHFVYLTLRQLF